MTLFALFRYCSVNTVALDVDRNKKRIKVSSVANELMSDK